ncbi:MAG: hypothetical protein QOH25_3636 [Acidobacteriota bacterium]|jgi:hypothetical protein|nr:hypothetical protein [Acidobacteriota bacterium]
MKHWRVAVYVLLALGLSACAASPSPNATGPRPNEPPYPILLTETAERREAALIAWAKFTSEQGITNAPAPELQPVTATIRSLPTFTGTPLYLPKVGDTVPMSEENTRESLRRFITSAIPLLGARQQQLSLVQRIDAADGTKKALYEQRPFRYPLRGGYGKLEITFAPDRHVLQLTSTCIIDTEQLQRAGAGTRPKWDAEKVGAQIAGRTFTYKDSAGNTQTLTIAQGEKVTVRELVIYPLPRLSNPAILEFHLAWEIIVERVPDSFNIYLDAVTDEIIGVNKFSE